MPNRRILKIGCLMDGATVYFEPAGTPELLWFNRQFPHVMFTHNAALQRDEIQYAEAEYHALLNYLRAEGWEAVSSGAAASEETLNLELQP
jgi:hypothetical protein